MSGRAALGGVRAAGALWARCGGVGTWGFGLVVGWEHVGL